jgi:hypothetical protein
VFIGGDKCAIQNHKVFTPRREFDELVVREAEE